jgi:S1-C subfamily serine protease
MGTGSFVNPNVVMTNHHVISGCKKIIARDRNKLYKAELIAYLRKDGVDLAFIRTDASSKNFVLLSDQNPKIGDLAFYPNFTSYQGIFTKSQGKVIKNSGNELLLFSPQGRHGNSGSPIFNDKGYLIGLLWGASGLVTTKEVIATSLTAIKRLAKENRVKLFSVNHQETNLLQEENFLEDHVVNVLCLAKGLKFHFGD